MLAACTKKNLMNTHELQGTAQQQSIASSEQFECRCCRLAARATMRRPTSARWALHLARSVCCCANEKPVFSKARACLFKVLCAECVLH